MSKQLGKIKAIRIGKGGYDNAMFGISFDLGGGGMGVGDFIGWWNMEPSKNAQWTVEQRDAEFTKAMLKLRELINQAKVRDANDLVGIPVEMTFSGDKLESWRILTEVL